MHGLTPDIFFARGYRQPGRNDIPYTPTNPERLRFYRIKAGSLNIPQESNRRWRWHRW